MTVKKIFAALLVPALSATLLAGTASAKYTCDAQTGARTWTFTEYETFTSNQYLYGNSLVTTSDNTLYTDQLLIYATSYPDEWFPDNSGIYTSYCHCISGSSISFKAPSNGTVSVATQHGSNYIYINNTNTTTATVAKDNTVKITVQASSASSYSDISSITFTPTKETKDFEVDPITIDSDTTDAGVIFKADGYDNWDCSIWNYVKNFTGTVNFNVKMNNVPNTVSVSAESYVK